MTTTEQPKTEPTTVDPAPATPDPQPQTVDPEPETPVPGAEPMVDHDTALEVVRDLPSIPGRGELTDLAATAVTLAAGNLVPGPLRGKPNDVFLVLLTGRDLGIKITTAIRELHVIEGKITLSPKVRLAMLRERPDIGKAWPDPGNSEWTATWHGTRADQPGTRYTSTFDWDDAQRVTVPKKGGGTMSLSEKDNWRNYPKRMLSWRALGYLMDDAFGEIGTGLYSPDEMGAVTSPDGEPVDVIDVEPLAQGMAGGRPTRSQAPPLLEEDERMKLLLRAKQLPEACRPEFAAFWKNAGLPKIDVLPAYQKPKADAAIQMFEKRAAKGEWGEYPATDQGATEAPQDEPAAPEAEAAPTGTDPDVEPVEAAQAAVTDNPAAQPETGAVTGCAHNACEVREDGSAVCPECGMIFDAEHEDGFLPEDEPF